MKIFIHKLLEELEGKVNTIYKDEAGFATIGMGHLLTQDEIYSGKIQIDGKFIKYKDGLTDDEVYDLLYQDLHKYESVVDVMTTADINFNQRTALISFCYNVGMKAFNHSTLLKKVNNYQFEQVPDQFMRWVYAGGKQSNILRNRRKREVEVWETQV